VEGEEAESGSVWLQVKDGPFQDLYREDGRRLDWKEHPRTFKVLGPVVAGLAGEVFDNLALVFQDLGYKVETVTTADD
jgi:hypothetical protein